MDGLSTANEANVLGNEAFADGRIDDAIELYTAGLHLGRTQDEKLHPVIYSNRSSAMAHKGQWSHALIDADHCTLLKPRWARGYACRGAALEGLGRKQEALDAFKRAADLDPNNATFPQIIAEIEETFLHPTPMPPSLAAPPQLFHPASNFAPGEEQAFRNTVNPDEISHCEIPATVARPPEAPLSMSRDPYELSSAAASEDTAGNIGLILSQGAKDGDYPTVVGVEAWSPLIDNGVWDGHLLLEVDGDDASCIPFAVLLRLLSGPPDTRVSLVFQSPPFSSSASFGGLLSAFEPQAPKDEVTVTRVVPPRPPRVHQTAPRQPPPALHKRHDAQSQERHDAQDLVGDADEEGPAPRDKGDHAKDVRLQGDRNEVRQYSKEGDAESGNGVDKGRAIGARPEAYSTMPAPGVPSSDSKRHKTFSIPPPPLPAPGGGWARQPESSNASEIEIEEGANEESGFERVALPAPVDASVPASSLAITSSGRGAESKEPKRPSRGNIYDVPAPSTAKSTARLGSKPVSFREAVDVELSQRKQLVDAYQEVVSLKERLAVAEHRGAEDTLLARCSLSIEHDYDQQVGPSNGPRAAAYAANLSRAVAESLNISQSRVRVGALMRGSVVADITITGSKGGALVRELARQAKDPTSRLRMAVPDARSCVATGGAAAEGEAMLDKFEAELEGLTSFARGGYSEESLKQALVMQGRLKPKMVEECYRAVHAIKWAKVEESMLKNKAYTDRDEAEKYAERLGRLVGAGVEEKIEKLKDKVASQELELVRIQEELAASKLERDKAVRELERVMEEDAEWRLEKESIQAEIALLFEERNSLRKHMDAETPYMVLSDGIPRRQDSLESLVPEFEWDVFLKGVETAVKRLQEDQEPATRGQEVPIGSLGQSLPETKQGYAKNVGNGIYEVGQVQESDEAKTLGQQQLRERVAGDDIANPSSQLAASTSKTTVELMEVPGNAVAPKFQDLSVHGESQQASVEQSMSEDHLDYLNAVNDQAKTVPRVSDGVKKLTPETEIQRVPSPSSASKTLQPVEVCACPEGWRKATSMFDYETENIDEHCFSEGEEMYVKEAPEDPGWFWAILVALGPEGQENVRLVPSTHVTLGI